MFVFFLLIAPDPPVPVSDHERKEQIAEERRALSLLNSSRYGDFDSDTGRWLSLAGLKQEDGYAWGLLPLVKNKARAQLQSILENSGSLNPDFLDPESKLLPSSFALSNLSLPVYYNVSGQLRGDFIREKPQDPKYQPALNLTSISLKHDYFTREFGRNITVDNGRLVFEFHQREGQDFAVDGVGVREMKVDMSLITDQSLGERWDMSLYGVHYPASGGMILSTTSEKFAGLSALPHFALSEDTFELSRQLLNHSLSATISQDKRQPANFFPWYSLPRGDNAVSFPAPRCEYVVYLQQHPVVIDGYQSQAPTVREIEKELRSPIGAPIPSPPPMLFSAVMFSPDCGFILETKRSPYYAPSDGLYLSGPKQEEYDKHAGHLIMAVAAALAAQISFSLRQMKESSTPSAKCRISFYTIAMMHAGDALFVISPLILLSFGSSLLLITATGFLLVFSVCLLGMKFMIEIWVAQAPEQRERNSRQNTEQAPATSTTQQTNSESLPLPATARGPANNGATPVILPPDQDETPEAPPARTNTETNHPINDAGIMYSRFYLCVSCTFFLTSWAMGWPRRLSNIYWDLLSFAYLSFWLPQIFRNIKRNCRKALRWEFVIGQSLLRILPFLYLYAVPNPVFFILLIEPSTFTTMSLVAWVWIQAWILVSQYILGARFFVPKGWAPPVYDYHPLLRDTSASGTGEDIESGDTLPVDFLRAEIHDGLGDVGDNNGQGNKDRQRKVFDCAICMQDIDVPILTNSATSGAAHIFSRRTYMVTPCRHIFHSACLGSWMDLRLQCPICRESIPPV